MVIWACLPCSQAKRLYDHSLGRTAALLLAAGLLLGSSNVTGKAITNINMIGGKWRGQIKLAGGPYEIFYLRVNRDGTIVVASWGATTEWEA